jgi:acyl-CoA synthetase (AMP-forming)/AMP-acid ligase II
MPSQLDEEIANVLERLTGPGGPFELGTFERFGRALPVIATAPASLPEMFARFCAEHGEAEFLIDGQTRLSFAETHALAVRLAAGLVARHGLATGDRVGIAARNSANWIVAYMAVLIAGGCATLLNGWWLGEELAEAIELAGCKLVLADLERAARLEGIAHGATVEVIAHGAPEESFAGLLAATQERAPEFPTLTGDDLATMLFTSGSTGKAKGAWSSHRSVVQAACNYAALSLTALTLRTERGEAAGGQPAALVNVPLFHVTGEVPLFLQSFIIGRKLAILPKWDPLEAMRLIDREKLTYFVGVPLMSIEIAEHPRRHEFDLSSCQSFAAGGAPRPAEHVGRIREALPHAFPLLGYGLTETNAVGCNNFNENYLAKPASTGPASKPLVEVAILDPAGQPVPQGQTGEIGFRTVCLFGGYWNNPEATAEVFTPDGFLRTGDLGYLDEDGYLFIVDRIKDLIIRGGENIACSEVESALYAHPGVAEASVFGLPHPRYGEVPVAVYVARPGATLCEQELRAFLGRQLAGFKVPERLWQERQPLPRLGTEKVDKRALKARYQEEWQ